MIVENIYKICNREDFIPKVAHETSQINTVVRLVESGLGYSIVPSSIKNAYNLNVKFIELKQYPERAEMFILYKNKDCSFIQNLIKCIND